MKDTAQNNIMEHCDEKVSQNVDNLIGKAKSGLMEVNITMW